MARWEVWSPGGGTHQSQVRAILRAVMGLHSTYSGEVWLWRGQARADYRLEPGMHSRVRGTPNLSVDEQNVRWATRQLIDAVREARLDRIEEMRLPDLALLAHLQHHGAATPLLDVTVDPLVGLWMVAHAGGIDPAALDDVDGLLFAVRRPPEDRWLSALDARSYWAREEDICQDLSQGMHWYRPPEISERLRIQRGSFLLGTLAQDADVTLPVKWSDGEGWLAKRIKGLGKPGTPATARTEVVAFRIRSDLKPLVREWLWDRAGLTQEVIYPTPWHRPFLEDFCRGYGRSRPIDFPS